MPLPLLLLLLLLVACRRRRSGERFLELLVEALVVVGQGVDLSLQLCGFRSAC